MSQENYIMEALETVSARSIPDEDDFVHAVIDQARLLARVDPDDFLESLIDIIN